jgi:hypothetical protein
MRLSVYERWQTEAALAIPAPPRLKYWQSEIKPKDIEIGRARERQLIAEAERIASTRNRVFPGAKIEGKEQN